MQSVTKFTLPEGGSRRAQRPSVRPQAAAIWPRARGQSKYGMFDRLWVGIVDILGVMWLKRRHQSGLAVREE